MDARLGEKRREERRRPAEEVAGELRRPGGVAGVRIENDDGCARNPVALQCSLAALPMSNFFG